jgi:hypothetical protein
MSDQKKVVLNADQKATAIKAALDILHAVSYVNFHESVGSQGGMKILFT